MNKLLGVTLGIMTALGGFVDFGQIVFTLQAGASFRYALLWPIVLGTTAIIVYMEMCGRIAVVAREPVFAVVRDRLGVKLGLIVLLASNLLNLITCAAELGGLAIVLHLLTGWPEKILLAGAAAALGGIVAVLRFEWIERIFGLAGVTMAVAAISAVMLGPDWKGLGHGLLPHLTMGDGRETMRYWFFAVGIFSAMLMEYEVHFYSSGALEEDWTEKDLPENFMVASLGSVLGALLTVALLVIGALVFFPQHRFPEQLRDAVDGIAAPFGRTGMSTIYVNDNFGQWRSDARKLLEYCLRPEAIGRKFVEQIRPEKEDYFVLKPMHSAFYQTPLEILLRYLNASSLILCGLATNSCIVCTAHDAKMRALQVFVPADCAASRSAKEHKEAIEHIERMVEAKVTLSGSMRLTDILRRAHR